LRKERGKGRRAVAEIVDGLQVLVELSAGVRATGSIVSLAGSFNVVELLASVLRGLALVGGAKLMSIDYLLHSLVWWATEVADEVEWRPLSLVNVPGSNVGGWHGKSRSRKRHDGKERENNHFVSFVCQLSWTR
jgi:hypothetical protein